MAKAKNKKISPNHWYVVRFVSVDSIRISTTSLGRRTNQRQKYRIKFTFWSDQLGVIYYYTLDPIFEPAKHHRILARYKIGKIVKALRLKVFNNEPSFTLRASGRKCLVKLRLIDVVEENFYSISEFKTLPERKAKQKNND